MSLISTGLLLLLVEALLLLSPMGYMHIGAAAGAAAVIVYLAWRGRARRKGRTILQSLRTDLWLWASFLAGLAVLKMVWLAFAASPPSDDHLTRRQYLIDKVARNPDFGPASMPYAVGKTFRKEWAIGTLSMTSAALANISFEAPETRQESAALIGKMIERMLQPDIRSYENDYWNEDALDSLAGSNGHIGYLGHLNLMLGAYRILGGGGEYDDLHRKISGALARRVEESVSGYLETFPVYIFVPDNVVVQASLAVHDRIYGAGHQAARNKWLAYTRAHLIEPASGLIVPWVSADGDPEGEARGSYAGWNSFYLPLVDRQLADDQFRRLRESFVRPLPGGAYAVREYRLGREGPADIDSGPVVFGISTSGTGFAVAGARCSGDQELYTGLLLTAEVVGSSIEWNGRRRYLLAPLIGDAIMLAMKTAGEWDGRYLIAG